MLTDQVFHLASEGHTGALKNIITVTGNPDYTDEAGNSLLSIAAVNGRAETVRMLLEAGADIYRSDRGGRTPLIKAALEGRTETVRILLEHAKTVSSRTSPSVTALMAANALELKGNTEIADLLRSHPG